MSKTAVAPAVAVVRRGEVAGEAAGQALLLLLPGPRGPRALQLAKALRDHLREEEDEAAVDRDGSQGQAAEHEGQGGGEDPQPREPPGGQADEAVGRGHDRQDVDANEQQDDRHRGVP